MSIQAEQPLIHSEEQLEQMLSAPSRRLIEDVRRLDGDIMLLGAGGKMSPTLAKLAAEAMRAAGVEKKVYAVSRFREAGLMDKLAESGVEAISCDLLDDDALQALPDVPNVIFMAGTKFGTTGKEHLTWAMSTYLPGRVAQKFRSSRIVVFSTGNVYPLTPVKQGELPRASPRLRSENTDNPASAVNGCSSIFRHSTERRSAFTG